MKIFLKIFRQEFIRERKKILVFLYHQYAFVKCNLTV